MMRDDVLTDYEKYRVTDEQERIWTEELLANRLEEVDINDYNSLFPLWYIIETNSHIEYLERLIELIENQLSNLTIQYSAVQFGQVIFDLLCKISKSRKDFSRITKLKCISIIDKLINRAKQLTTPEGFIIPNFDTFSDGLTEQQYILRRIVDLEEKMGHAKILE